MRVLYFSILLSCLKNIVCVNVTGLIVSTPIESRQNFKIGEKSNQFVDLIKQDLRRNNDDYDEKLNSAINQTSTNSTTKVVSVAPKIPSVSYRRMAYRDHKTIVPVPEDNFSIAPPNAEGKHEPGKYHDDPSIEPTAVDLRAPHQADPRHKRIVPILPQLPNMPHHLQSENRGPDVTLTKDTAVYQAKEYTPSTLGFGSVPMRHFDPVRRQPSSLTTKRPRLKLGNLLPQLQNLLRTTTITTTTTTEKSLKDLQRLTKNKLNRFRQLLFKNKDLLNRFVSYKQQQRTSGLNVATPEPEMDQAPVLPAQQKPLAPLIATESPIKLATLSRQAEMGKMMPQASLGPPGSLRKSIHSRKKRLRHGKRHRQKPIGRQGTFLLSAEHLPDDTQLDMAPAKGARIEHMRIKGRICHRHVLMPEGPKYDSKGHVYLKEFVAPRPKMDYAITNAPRLLLPRCCNCCKKSVLGCE